MGSVGTVGVGEVTELQLGWNLDGWWKMAGFNGINSADGPGSRGLFIRHRHLYRYRRIKSQQRTIFHTPGTKL